MHNLPRFLHKFEKFLISQNTALTFLNVLFLLLDRTLYILKTLFYLFQIAFIMLFYIIIFIVQKQLLSF
ncbi:hypothetical protein A3C65_02565 [Candidatus Nomurabacteria bacterium RIFCSPHIGHO2_02_FULL_41_150]|nr:MAG: hypothetical protein A3C65_02565 [Candidatus Nomurabacteria bacterium RIFCSPHIGHO2_02_FULL_41_150]OGI81688.1 MAG: hypothetical protein A3E03_04130 [Candidatus Nomurabacteria bacterium RIFCSPHIGHO2_12_FULL_40_64]